MADEIGHSVVMANIENQLHIDPSDDGEPCKKKLKCIECGTPREDGKLEDRLSGILCCVVCLDLPKMTVFQCSNGHLMCAGCLMHLLADGRLKDEAATCPSCRCEISKTGCIRNLAVEKAISEMPALCQHCAKAMPRHTVDRHERELCAARPEQCKYASLGCEWVGTHEDLYDHETSCGFPHKAGEEIMAYIKQSETKQALSFSIYKDIFDLLSLEKVTFNDIQLRPYRTDEYVTKLFFEAGRFTAFNCQWIVKARVNVDSSRNPVHCCNRSLSYQLLLKTKPSSAVVIRFFILRGPHGDADVRPVVQEFEFSGDKLESPHYELPLANPLECNRLLSLKIINLRLILFQL